MSTDRIRFGMFELDLHTGEVFKEARRIRLQDQPTRLLILLASRPGELVTRTEIQETLWKDGEFVEFEHAVNTAVRKIRIALEDDSDQPRVIETLPKKGYRFIAPVKPAERTGSSTADDKVPQISEPAQLQPPRPGDGFVLPISQPRSRQLFLLAQVPYVASYLAAFYHWDSGLEGALRRIFGFVPIQFSLPLLHVTALVGFAIRIYLIGLVAWKHDDAGPRFRKIFPLLLVLDGIWAATPLLVEHSLSPVVGWAGLVLMGWLIFGQRTLMLRIEQNR